MNTQIAAVIIIVTLLTSFFTVRFMQRDNSYRYIGESITRSCGGNWGTAFAFKDQLSDGTFSSGSIRCQKSLKSF